MPASEKASLNKKKQHYCSVQDEDRSEFKLLLDFQSCCPIESMKTKTLDAAGRVRPPSCSRIDLVIIFFKSFELLVSSLSC